MTDNRTADSSRIVDFNNIKIGDTNCPPIFCLDVSIFNTDDNFQIVKDFYGTNDRKEILQKAQETGCDILGLKFNIEGENQINEAVSLLKELLPFINKPLMIRGVNNDAVDKLLLPELIKVLNRECIISSVNENTYKEIVPAAVSGNHVLVLKSPIDINLAKELNILSSDLGLSLDKILIDTDIGGLGYGLEYGYSIMEKIKLEGLNGDEYLNMPMISFATEESLKTKEAKSDNYPSSFGNLKERAEFFEICSASAVMAAGVSVIVLNNPLSIDVMKGLM